MAKFDRVYIEISNICNLQCSFCPEVERDKKIMEFALFKSTIDQLQGLTSEVTFHLMGEPMTHPEFGRFLAYCEQVKMNVQLTTNGTLIKDENRAQHLLSPAIRQVNFSLQSYLANYPDKEVKNYLHPIFQWTKKAMTLRPDLYVNFRLWSVGGDGIAEEQRQTLVTSINNEFGSHLPVSADVGFRKSKHIQARLYAHFDSRFEWPNRQRPVRSVTGFCYALKNHFGVHADGTIVPCCLDKESDLALGKVQEGILLALNSERALKMLRGFARNELCEGLCQRCGFISRFDKKTQFDKNQRQLDTAFENYL